MLSRPWYIVLKSEKNGGSNRHSLKMFTEAHEFDQKIPSQNDVLQNTCPSVHNPILLLLTKQNFQRMFDKA